MTRPTSTPITRPRGYPPEGDPIKAAEIIRAVADACGQALK